MSVVGWHSFGVNHENIKDNGDMGALARALHLLGQCVPEVDWYNGTHEFWVLECPCAPSMVCVRPHSNPFDCGYVVSPIPMPHLASDASWEQEMP
mgnify:FL=1